MDERAITAIEDLIRAMDEHTTVLRETLTFAREEFAFRQEATKQAKTLQTFAEKMLGITATAPGGPGAIPAPIIDDQNPRVQRRRPRHTPSES